MVTIVDRVGPYDEYALQWLYGSYSGDSEEKARLDSLVRSKEGLREYLYVPLQKNNPDPRANEFDLGSDPFDSFDSAMSHLRFAAENADRWFDRPDIPEEEFKQLYVEWMWLRLIDNTRILSPLVGGVYSDDVRADSCVVAHFRAVPEEVQRKAVQKVLDSFTDVSWLDENKKLMTMSGLYSSFSGLTYMNAVGQSRLISRMPYIARAGRVAGSTYTREKFLSDFQNAIFANVRKGRLAPQEDDMIMRYLRSLIVMSPVLKSNFDMAFHVSRKSLSEDIFLPLSGIGAVDVEGQDIVAMKALQNARKSLVAGRSRASDPYTRGKIDFLVRVIDVSLNMQKP